MATLDMYDVLSSPEFLDQAAYVRTTVTIGDNGRAVTVISPPMRFTASLQPGRGARMVRAADGSKLSGDLLAWSQTWLTNGIKVDDTTSLQADIIHWHGRRYTVTNCVDWSAFSAYPSGNLDPPTQFGRAANGFFVVTADLLPLNPVSGA